MTDYLSNGLQYIPAIVAPDNTYGIFFYSSGVNLVRAPFGGTQYNTLAITSTGSIDFLNKGGAASGALIHGAGTSGSPALLGSTAGNGLSYYMSSSATSGDVRGMDLRLYLAGAGSAGEALRAYTTVNGVSVAGTVNGAHISLGLTGAGATIAGQGFGLRVSYAVANSVTTVGGASNAVMLVESDIATGPTFHANTAFIRFNNYGAQKLANLFSVTNPDTSAMFVNAGTGAGSAGQASGSVCAKALKIIVDGVNYWIGLNSTNS